MGTLTCAEVHEIAPELAVGAVGGEERGRVLTHIHGCAPCRVLVEDLATVADGLLSLAPGREPPIGFESRVLAALGEQVVEDPVPVPAPSPSRPSRWRGHRTDGEATGGGGSASHRPARRSSARWAAVAAAVAAVALATGAAVGAFLAGHGAGSDLRLAVARAPGGRPVCQAFARQGRPSFVLVTVDEPGEEGQYAVELRTARGTQHLGTMQIAGGRGTLGAVADFSVREARSVRVVEPDGEVRYEAVFGRA